MDKKKIALLAILGSLFVIAGIYFNNMSFLYLGIGTWSSGIIYYVFFPGHKEIMSLILGLLVLHTGVLILLRETYQEMKFLGFLIFTAGIVIVLNSGISEYMKKRKIK
ncbi:MAG: hypothetical protein OIN87_07525 [Candidatus Methanoperedens sp.]|nr:hypothetical protein [Candidatus Methanoperedens sp.]